MDNNHDSAGNYPTEQFGPVGGQPDASAPGSGGRPRRGRPAIRWAASVAAVAVLIGGAAALATSTGSSSPASTTALDVTGPGSAGQAAALGAVLSSAGSPAGAGQAAALAAGATVAPGTAAGHPCATAVADLRAAGHPRLARRAAAVCRGRLGRLRLLVRGEHGEVTYRTQGGTAKTLAFERGTVIAVTGTAVTVQAADGTTWTWHLVSDSVVRQDGKKVSASSLAAGQQAFAGGPVVNGTDDARLIVIRPATAPAAAPSASSS